MFTLISGECLVLDGIVREKLIARGEVFRASPNLVEEPRFLMLGSCFLGNNEIYFQFLLKISIFVFLVIKVYYITSCYDFQLTHN